MPPGVLMISGPRSTLLFVLTALCAQGFAGAAEPDADQLAFIRAHPARQNYVQFCAGCHGPELQGGSFHGFIEGEWKHGSAPADVRRSIVEGIIDAGMPAFDVAFSDAEIDALVDYVRGAADPPLAPSGARLAQAEPEEVDPSSAQVRTVRDYKVAFEFVAAGGLKDPWGIDFLNERTALVTEKPGRLRWMVDGEIDPRPIRGIPAVRNQGQGGLMDVAIDPQFDEAGNDWVYLSFAHGRDGNKLGMTKIVRGKIRDHAWTNEQVIFEARSDDYVGGGLHFGSRIVFDHEGRLLFAIGDRGRRIHAQRLDKPNGKVHRINRDGSIPADNPYARLADAGPGSVYRSIFSFGHRNPQGLAIDPISGELWLTEHGPRGGDELNLARAGRNYGWPIITYGINYNGTTITDAFERPGLEQPNLYWIPSIAVCGLDVYRDGPFERWRGDLFAGGLVGEVVERLAMHEDRVMHREVVVQGGGRVRDVCCAPDGAIYIVQNRPDRIVRVRYAGRARPE